MVQFHIPFVQLDFTLLRRLMFLLNLSSEQRKFSSELLEKIKNESFLVRKLSSNWDKICYSRPNSPSSYTNYRPYIVPPRVEPHCQLPSPVGPLVLMREKYPCNAISVRKCMPTKAQRVFLSFFPVIF